MLRSPPIPLSVLLKSAIPFIVAPTGTMANNGAITLGTALATTFANCFLFLPANAISAGSTQGWYFTQMSSATAGTVFNNTYSSGTPAIPASPTAFVTTGPGAYTGVTGNVNAQAVTIPANSMGPNGRIRYLIQSSNNNSAGTKNTQVQVGPGPSIIAQLQNTTNLTLYTLHEWANRGVTGAQVCIPAALAGPNPSSGAPLYTAVDTTANITLQFVLNMNTATDYVVMESLLVEVFPG